MDLLHVDGWQIESNPEATRERYRILATQGSLPCDCLTCRNFSAVVAAGTVFPTPLRDLCERLGIDKHYPAEIVHYGRQNAGLHHYGGWYHFVGHLAGGSDAFVRTGKAAWQVRLHAVAEHVRAGFTQHVQLVPEAFAGCPVAQLEFEADLPWLLAESEAE